MEKQLNQTQQHVIELLKSNEVKIVNPIMLTKTQLVDYYSVSCNYMSTGIHIPENEINEQELKEKCEDYKYIFILNKVWTQKD